MAHYPAIIVGGGQAGLAASYLLKLRRIDHLVLERNRVGHAWRDQRWDTFCLVTPNWQCQLPGHRYAGSDPEGFMAKDQIIRYLEQYAESFDPPLLEGVEVRRMTRSSDGIFQLEVMAAAGESTTHTADSVIVATGNYHVPIIPRSGERLPADVAQIHSADYKRPEQMPPGAVLVVGTGQSGSQIAEDLHLAGRDVHVCVGSAPRVARRYRGRDVVDWLAEMGFYDMPVESHPDGYAVRRRANHYVTGRDGGRDIDLRQRAAEGMHLHGRLDDVRGSRLHLGPNLEKDLDHADQVSENIKSAIDKYITGQQIDVPQETRYTPVWRPPAEPARTLDLAEAGITSVIWSVGYRSDFRWVGIPVFDGDGYPGHVRGVTPVPGLYFLGLPWLYTWGSGRFSGIARDAEFIVEHLAGASNASGLSLGSNDGIAAVAGPDPNILEPAALTS